uniref:Uncharacterized protein n=1 Tax=Aegilops tauschii subsp. strangulata TaxID=200361 RepID=A0A453SBI0_AEGTS
MACAMSSMQLFLEHRTLQMFEALVLKIRTFSPRPPGTILCRRQKYSQPRSSTMCPLNICTWTHNSHHLLAERLLCLLLAGHPALIGLHQPFRVTHQAAERSLHHMQQALET